MQVRQKKYEEIYDVSAIRIIVNTNEECYRVLAVVHDCFRPIPGRFKDYIGLPKPNRYQSLHTVVIGPNGRPLEVQIRTWEMHHIAEYGIAAHWKYKETNSSNQATSGKKMKNLPGCGNWWSGNGNSKTIKNISTRSKRTCLTMRCMYSRPRVMFTACHAMLRPLILPIAFIRNWVTIVLGPW
jgi:(p)ppGpp synthase/HD superfamily hydrolase